MNLCICFQILYALVADLTKESAFVKVSIQSLSFASALACG